VQVGSEFAKIVDKTFDAAANGVVEIEGDEKSHGDGCIPEYLQLAKYIAPSLRSG
jgi:hypothetical protein